MVLTTSSADAIFRRGLNLSKHLYSSETKFTHVDARAAYLISGSCIDFSAIAVEIQPGATAFARPEG